MTKHSAVWLAAFVAVIAGVAPAARAEVKGAWVTTDRTVDCSSLESIVAGVVKPGMTDEQKAIAMYTFFRQMVYHYTNIPESRDPVKCVNVIGNTLCGSQATCMKGLLEAAGIKTRVVSGPGHTFYEAFYDGQWHGYDTFMNFYVFTRGDKPHVASYAEIKADNTLATKAVEEKRAVAGFLPCGDTLDCFIQGVKELAYQPQKLDWNVKDYALRPGEELVRSWWPLGLPLAGAYSSKDPGPMHGCGRRDEGNPPELFQYWEPYGIRGMGGKSISYRHYCNGWMAYAPDLTQSPLKEALAAGTLTIPVKCPFYIVGAKLAFEATCPGAEDAVEVSATSDGKTWNQVLTAKDTGAKVYQTGLDIAGKSGRGPHAYQVKLALKGKAALQHLHLKTVFTHNAMAAPHLMPGKNRVTVTVGNPDTLKAEPLSLVYRYKDAPNWSGTVKTIEKTVDASPFTFETDLPDSKKLPQMQDMTLRCGTLAWTPPVASTASKVVFDFNSADSVKPWLAKADTKVFQIAHDGQGMLVKVAGGSKYPQIYAATSEKNWSEFAQLAIDMDNEGDAPLTLCLRLQSNDTNDERSDIELKAGKGRNALQTALAAFKKTKLNAVTRLYIMVLNVPESGATFRMRKVTLEPKTGAI